MKDTCLWKWLNHSLIENPVELMDWFLYLRDLRYERSKKYNDYLKNPIY